MTKYEIFKNEITFPIREKNKIKLGCTLLSDNQFPEKLEEYIDLDSAKKELSKYVSSIEQEGTTTGTRYRVTEYYIEENAYNEDGEWISGGDIWGFSKFPGIA